MKKGVLIDAVGSTAFGVFMFGLARAGLDMMVNLTSLGAGLLDIVTIGGIVAIPIAVVKSGKQFHFLEENDEASSDWTQMPRDTGALPIEKEEEVTAETVEAVLPEVPTTDVVVPATTTLLVDNQVQQQTVLTQNQNQFSGAGSVPAPQPVVTSEPSSTPASVPSEPEPVALDTQQVDSEWEALFRTVETMAEYDNSSSEYDDEYSFPTDEPYDDNMSA